MNASCSMFSQILKLIPRTDFERIVKETGAEYRSKGLSSWSQFVGMLFCQLGRAHALREIEGGLKSCEGKLAHLGITVPVRSSLSYANGHRPWQLFEKVFYGLFETVAAKAVGKKKFRFKNKLVSLDSTVIDLCLSMYDWAKFRRTKGAVKLHLVLDHDGYLPCFGLVTEGHVADVTAARHIVFTPGTIVVDDRGYNDDRLFANWTEARVYFVTRMKDNAQFEVVEEREPPQNRNILTDQTIRLTGTGAHEKCPHLLRRVEALREDTGDDLGVSHQSSQSRRVHHRRPLQGSLADRAVLQSAHTEPEDQDVRRHLGQCGEDSDLDSIDLDVARAVSATGFPVRLEPSESRGAAAHEPIHPSRLDGLARSTVHHTTPSTRSPSNPVGLGVILDSTRRHNLENSS